MIFGVALLSDLFSDVVEKLVDANWSYKFFDTTKM